MNRSVARALARGFTLLEVVIAVVLLVAISALVLPAAVRRAASPPEQQLIDAGRDAMRHARAAAVRAGVPAILVPTNGGGGAMIEVTLAEPIADENSESVPPAVDAGEAPARGGVRFALAGFSWIDSESIDADVTPLAAVSPDGFVTARSAASGLRGRGGDFWLRFGPDSGAPSAGVGSVP